MPGLQPDRGPVGREERGGGRRRHRERQPGAASVVRRRDHGRPGPAGNEPTGERHPPPAPGVSGARAPAPRAGQRHRAGPLRDDDQRRPGGHRPPDPRLDRLRQDRSLRHLRRHVPAPRRSQRGRPRARQRHVQRPGGPLPQVRLGVPSPESDRADPTRVRGRHGGHGRHRRTVASGEWPHPLLERLRGGGRRRAPRAARLGRAGLRRFELVRGHGHGRRRPRPARRVAGLAGLPLLRGPSAGHGAGAASRGGRLRLRPERVHDAPPARAGPRGVTREDDPGRAAEARRLGGPGVERRGRGLVELHPRGPRRRRDLVPPVLLSRQPLPAGGALGPRGKRAPGGGIPRKRGRPLRLARRRRVRLLERAVQPHPHPGALGPAQQPGPRRHRLSPPRAAGLARAVPPERPLPALRDRPHAPVRQDLRRHGGRAAPGRPGARHRAGVRGLRPGLPRFARMGQRDRAGRVAALRLDG